MRENRCGPGGVFQQAPRLLARGLRAGRRIDQCQVANDVRLLGGGTQQQQVAILREADEMAVDVQQGSA